MEGLSCQEYKYVYFGKNGKSAVTSLCPFLLDLVEGLYIDSTCTCKDWYFKFKVNV